ncbi:hypothetical protein PTTG_03070 [Puccinia triticina 1-1 BBBD Race 1]|uniref:HMG box domain-containing protein n=2 Tax=Puccinia triticina TaxID=208348 RepID=A0A180GP05_PUCT1|nr:uncharacterized protein PtA15_12A349 [Puccinia triticina]OAV94450.1 hypothetical protein PTTG_03070 [Puccinia triticina 1-1 BBBD Race 1]WAQ90360.1 hypothetical protein PtA15_12A349 [Puccinia triticina]WAR61678.1 hypothetical protein PtB15_12B368 [Puccinia triticina]
MVSEELSVGGFLGGLGLGDYLQIFLSEGFDTIRAIQEITEEDLEQMQVKRGHRRILQRALGKPSSANGLVGPHSTIPHRLEPGSSFIASISSPSFSAEGHLHGSHRERSRSWDHESSQSGSSLFAGVDSNLSPSQAAFGTNVQSRSTSLLESPIKFFLPTKPKRRYRRHPKADLNAPKRPLSAYVMFSNTVREQLKGQQISFTDIARTVGDRWKTLDPSTKEAFEREASEQKDRWTKSMLAYKRTREYEQHRRYLQQFKEAQQARNAVNKAQPKRFSDVDRSSTQSFAVESEVNNDSCEVSDFEDGERDVALSHPIILSPVPPSEGVTTNSSLTDASPHPSPTSVSAYHLPPPITNKTRIRPTIPNLCTLDKHLTESQTLFFKSNYSIRNSSEPRENAQLF